MQSAQIGQQNRRIIPWPRLGIVRRRQCDITLEPANVDRIQIRPMAPRHSRTCILREMPLFCSEVEQRTLLYTVVEAGDVGDELHVDDVPSASFAGIRIAEDLEGEGRLGDLGDVYWCGLVGRDVGGAVGGGAAGR